MDSLSTADAKFHALRTVCATASLSASNATCAPRLWVFKSIVAPAVLSVESSDANRRALSPARCRAKGNETPTAPPGQANPTMASVSYTHLTLPTSDLV